MFLVEIFHYPLLFTVFVGAGCRLGGQFSFLHPPPLSNYKNNSFESGGGGGGEYPCQLFTAFFKFCGFQNEGSKWVSLMLSNKVVFLTQRYPKFKERCWRWNNFLRQGIRGGGRFRSTPCFFNSTPLHLVVPAQVLAVFSFLRQLVNRTTGLTQNATGQGLPCFHHGFLLMSPNCGWLSVSVRVL